MSKKAALFFSELKRIRKLRKITQQEMAAKLGISDTQYQNYETKTIPPHENLLEINMILGVDLSRHIYQDKLGKNDNELLRELQELVKKFSSSDDDRKTIRNLPGAQGVRKSRFEESPSDDKLAAQDPLDEQDSNPEEDK